MNVFELIELKKSAFTRTDMIVYNALFENNEIVFRKSSSQLAKDLNLSQASIIRFCKKLGFDGFNDFRFSLYDSLHSSGGEAGLISKAECYKKIVDMLFADAEEGKYDDFAQKMEKAEVIYTTGLHRSSLPAQLLAIELSMLGKKAFFIRDDMMSCLPDNTNSTEVFVCFSEQGDSSRTSHYEMFRQIPETKKPQMFLITMSAKHPLRKMFDHMILLPGSTNQKMPERVEPSNVFSVFVDVVIDLVTKMKEETMK